MPDISIRDRIRYRRENAVDPETFLREVGAIRPSEGTEQLRFTTEFASRTAGHLETFREEGVDTATVAGIFGADDADVEVADRPYVAFEVEHAIRNWPSEAALAFDAATDAALREVTDQWEAVPPRQRYRILQSLRSFQDRCFFCDGPIAFSEEAVESCCREALVLSLRCADCERRFMEFSTEGSSDSFGRLRGGDAP